MATTNSTFATMEIVLDSRHANQLRDNGSTATFAIREGLDYQSESQCANVQLLCFEAVNTIYNITSKNNTIEFLMQSYKQDYSGLETSDEPVQVSIPFGNYTLTSLLKTLNDAITAILSVPEDDVSKQDLFVTKVDFNDYNGLVTFEIIGLNELGALSTSAGSYNSTTNIISNYEKTIYSGIYVLTDNYTGLLETLGFNVSYLSPLLTGKPHYGFGVKLTPQIDLTGTEADPIISTTYVVDANWAATINASNAYSINKSLGYFTSGSVANLSYPNCIYISIDGIQTKK